MIRPPSPLDFFDLRSKVSSERLRVPQGRAYLFKKNGAKDDPQAWRLIDLGSTSNSDRIKVRGADENDRLCVFANGGEQPLAGCLPNLQDYQSTIPLEAIDDWAPEIQVEPVYAIDMSMIITAPVESGDPVVEITTYSGEEPPTVSVDPPSAPAMPYTVRIEDRLVEYAIELTPGEPFDLQLVNPGLEVVVKNYDPTQCEKLNVQLFPGYALPEGSLSAPAPSAMMIRPEKQTPIQPPDGIAMASSNTPEYEDFCSYTFEMENPVYLGHVRLSEKGAKPVKEMINEFFVSPNFANPDSFGNVRPGSGNVRPGSGNVRPGSGNVRVGSGNVRPGSGNVRPGSGNVRPGSGNVRVGSGNVRPGSGNVRVGSGNVRPGSGNVRPGSGNVRVGSANQRTMGAPVSSADGQVTIFSLKDLICDDTSTSTLQGVTTLPDLAPWLTTVGSGYRFITSDIQQQSQGDAANALDDEKKNDLEDGCSQLLSAEATKKSIAFSYLQRDVPRGYEQTLQIYHRFDLEEADWHAITTIVDTDANLATAELEGPGLYALIATVNVPIKGPGWSLFSYPIPQERSVDEALASIAGEFTTVYGYDPNSANAPWRIFDASLPSWVQNETDIGLSQYDLWSWVLDQFSL